MRVLVAVCALLLCLSPAEAQNFYYTAWPYGAFLPPDPSKIVFGKTMAEVCAARSDKELILPEPNPPTNPVTFVGMTSATTCGFTWANVSGCGGSGCVIANPDFTPTF